MAETMNRGTTTYPPQSKDVVDTMKDKAKDIVAGASNAANAAKDKVKDVAATAKDKVGDMASAAGDFALQAKDKVQEWTTTAAHEAQDAVQDMGKELTTLVRRYPFQALLAGFAVGFLVSRATSRS